MLIEKIPINFNKKPEAIKKRVKPNQPNLRLHFNFSYPTHVVNDGFASGILWNTKSFVVSLTVRGFGP